MSWPRTADALASRQAALGEAAPRAWMPADRWTIGGCFVCFPRGASGAGRRGDMGWAAAVVLRDGEVVARAVHEGRAGAPFEPGLLALREGRLLEAAVRATGARPDVLLVNATGRDHPRRAGLALHLGAVLDLPTVGVTHRPLVSGGTWPVGEAARSPLMLEGETVGYWLRTRPGTRPLAVHAAWRTDAETAVAVVLASLRGRRTPEPLRLARTLAREARATAAGTPA